MGRWNEQWTREQKEAVGRAMLQEPGKLNARQAVDALMAGALQVQVPPKRMPHSTAYMCRDQERKRQLGYARSPLSKVPLDEARATLRERLITLVELDMNRLEAQVREGKADRRDIALAVRTLKELEALRGTQKRREQREEPKADNPVTQLLQAAQDQGTTQPAVPAQPMQSGSAAHGHDRSPVPTA